MNGRNELVGGKAIIEFPQEGSGADPVPTDFALVCVDPTGGRSARSPDELESALRVESINSVADYCAKFAPRIEGECDGPDGVSHSFSIPVLDDNSFSPDELTRRDPKLRAWYLTMKVAESIELHLAKSGRNELTDEELSYLEALEETLSSALAGEDTP